MTVDPKHLLAIEQRIAAKLPKQIEFKNHELAKVVDSCVKSAEKVVKESGAGAVKAQLVAEFLLRNGGNIFGVDRNAMEMFIQTALPAMIATSVYIMNKRKPITQFFTRIACCCKKESK